jgi:transmembrane sensor
MDPFLQTYDNLPWDMIVSALQGALTPEEEPLFRQWLTASEANREKYAGLERIWKEGLADYAAYREADEVKALAALRQMISDRATAAGFVAKGNRPTMRRWMAAAAVLLLAAGAGWWYVAGKRSTGGYETALNERKSISLPDGTTVDLQPGTRMQVVPGYDQASRTVILHNGDAHFNVIHKEQIPFTVDMDVASIKDIGTDFILHRTEDTISVTVSGGKVAFIQKETGESREIAAGNSLTYYIREKRFGQIAAADGTTGDAQDLRFNNSSLSEVIAALQKLSGRKISLSDTALGQKKLTVRLGGESFENSLKIICASLDLEYMEKNGEYIVKPRSPILHN